MQKGTFEWNERKAEINLLKHGISFIEATSCFLDPKFIFIEDKKHSMIELRYIGIGRSVKSVLLTTAFTNRGSNIRIISSRRANKKERIVYEADN